MNDEAIRKIGCQVQALEMVVKAMIAIQFASTVKDEAGFGKAAEAIKAIGAHLQEQVRGMSAQLSPSARASGLSDAWISEMGAVIGRCFEQPAASLQQVADLILEVMPPATDAKN
jgi:hypothetical protein